MSTESWPRVSIVMTVVNEERHLGDAIDRLLTQDYPGPLEIVVAVGPSRDRTRDVARQVAESHDHVTVVDNPSGRTPAGLNAAIAASSGDVIVRIDGHAMVPRDYVRSGVRALAETGADNVGGIMAAEGTTPFESAVAAAMTSWFGVGSASFHIGGEAGPAPTVYLGCFRRSALEAAGGFDESMVRAQDWELNHRLRAAGGTIWFTPSLSVRYRPRGNLGALARQYHGYGRWRREVVRRHPETASARYLAAPATVLSVAAGTAIAVVAAATGHPRVAVAAALAPLGYAAGVAVATAMAARRVPASVALRLPAVFATMHAAWGTGFLRGAPR